MSERIRIDEPGYVARYRAARQRTATDASGHDDPDAPPAVDDDVPAYLRAYRSRSASGGPAAGESALVDDAAADDAPDVAGAANRAELAPTGSTISPPAAVANDVFLVRHGETDALDELGDLSEQGRWQAHSYGRRLSTELHNGERVVVVHAGSQRAASTAAHAVDGLGEACAERGIDVEIEDAGAAPEFANFGFAGPTGPVDIVEAFAAYRAGVDPAWQVDPADPPLWAFELDRLWKIQLSGGDPVQHWLTTPSIHAEPAAMVVRRVWGGIQRLGDEHPGARLLIATHGGVARAFALAALGYDPGDPYNAEHVRAKILTGRNDALVSYRNRHQEICVPTLADLPIWKTIETWQPPAPVPAS